MGASKNSEFAQLQGAGEILQPSDRPSNRMILLGASNLTLSLRLIIQLMQHRCGSPSEVFVAAGHGRSYGQFSQVLMRGLPGIASSGLWAQLDSVDTLPTYAFLTDIGNDILYGSEPEQILAWISECVQRLQRQSVCLVMTNLPIASIESLSEWRYQLFRNLLYPFCQLSRLEIIDRARSVHRGLMALASDRHFELCEQDPIWFGHDGIHVSYWKRRALYQHFLERFPMSHEGLTPVVSSWKQRPQFAYKTMWGREQRCQQPSGQLTDGTTVALY